MRGHVAKPRGLLALAHDIIEHGPVVCVCVCVRKWDVLIHNNNVTLSKFNVIHALQGDEHQELLLDTPHCRDMVKLLLGVLFEHHLGDAAHDELHVMLPQLALAFSCVGLGGWDTHALGILAILRCGIDTCDVRFDDRAHLSLTHAAQFCDPLEHVLLSGFHNSHPHVDDDLLRVGIDDACEAFATRFGCVDALACTSRFCG